MAQHTPAVVTCLPSMLLTPVTSTGCSCVKFLCIYLRAPRWLSGKEPACQCRRCRFGAWVGKIPWQSTPVFVPGKSYAQRSLAGSPQPFWHQDQFRGRQFFHGWGQGMFWGDSSSLYLLCISFLLLLHQIHLRASGIRSQRMWTPE